MSRSLVHFQDGHFQRFLKKWPSSEYYNYELKLFDSIPKVYANPEDAAFSPGSAEVNFDNDKVERIRRLVKSFKVVAVRIVK